MFLAIITKVNIRNAGDRLETVTLAPIKTGELANEVMSRLSMPLIATRGSAEKALRAALEQLEHDTKQETVNLSLLHF